MDAVIVRYLARKAKRLARKWGGQCIVFIDEIDAVGMRRAEPRRRQRRTQPVAGERFDDFCFYGPNGALTPSGDLILETRAWRDRLFAERAPEPGRRTAVVQRLGGHREPGLPRMLGGMGGGGRSR